MNARSKEYLMKEIRKSQKKLLSAKKHGNSENEYYLRVRISDLRKEMESAV
jgi:hypothetical protein